MRSSNDVSDPSHQNPPSTLESSSLPNFRFVPPRSCCCCPVKTTLFLHLVRSHRLFAPFIFFRRYLVCSLLSSASPYSGVLRSEWVDFVRFQQQQKKESTLGKAKKERQDTRSRVSIFRENPFHLIPGNFILFQSAQPNNLLSYPSTWFAEHRSHDRATVKR